MSLPTKQALLSTVDRLCEDLDDQDVYGDPAVYDGESRYMDVHEALGEIDWGRLPADAIRKALRAIVRNVPAEWLEEFRAKVERTIGANESCRVVYQYETATGDAYPIALTTETN